MLNLNEVNSFWRDVSVKVPTGKAKGYKTVTFKAEFKLLDMDELNALRENEEEGNSLLDEVLLNVDEVKVDVGEDALEMCKKNILVAGAIVKTYLSVISQDEARKNSRK